MLAKSQSQKFNPEESIFPLITYNPKTNIWKCLGTGFFINPYGGFVTAKHVAFENENSYEPTLYAIQTTKKQERHLRPIAYYRMHRNADIVVGYLGKRRLSDGSNVEPEIAPAFQLNLKPLSEGDEVRTFAFPLSEAAEIESGTFELSFKGTWSAGKIIELMDRSPLVNNKCYHTNMKIEGGASGGPVLKNNVVIGINSSGFDITDGDPISFVTPIDLILSLKVPDNREEITIHELVKKGHIKTSHR